MGSIPGGKVGVLLLGVLLTGTGFGLVPAMPGVDDGGLRAKALHGTDAARSALHSDGALAAYLTLVAERARLDPSDAWDQAGRNARAAQALSGAQHPASGVAAAQALQADLDLRAPGHVGAALPSMAILALLADHGVTPDSATLLQIHALDLLPVDARDALGATVTAFRSFQAADRAVAGPGDLGAVLQARTALVDAAERLADALGDGPAKSGPLQIENLLALDLGPGANTYTKDFMLLIDAGGDETYTNNAGGNGYYVSPCTNLLRAQAALIDLGGNDAYTSGRGCGVNGGAINGAGLLFDRSGNDVYVAGGEATNGGAKGLGTGLLLDLRGDDTYTAGSMATNGGGLQFGIGALLDGGGNDRYTARALGTNGGASQTAHGLLADLGGDDSYTAEGGGTNGGASFSSAGLLYDAGGRDQYTAGAGGTNGGGDHFGAGLLYDHSGDDAYHGVRLGSNGGGSRAGLGSLVDRDGNDVYEADARGVNGGAYGGGPGILLDAAGNDFYAAAGEGANGGAFFGEAQDVRVCPLTTVCFRPQGTWALLFDVSGADAYRETLTTVLGHDVTIVPKGTVGAQVDLEQ